MRCLSCVAVTKKALMLACATVISMAVPAVYADSDKTLSFVPPEVDFGTMREDAGPVSMTLKAVNVSSGPTYIISARTGCGCSALEYPDDFMAVGDTAEIKVTYDPSGRPGRFLKTVKVFTGDERISNSFKIKGNVIPSRDNLDRVYPDKAGQLRLSSAFLTAGELMGPETRPLYVGIYNDADTPLVFAVSSDSKALDPGIVPDSIGPYEVATLTLMLKGREMPPSTVDFTYNAYIKNAATGDTIVRIPVNGSVKRHQKN